MEAENQQLKQALTQKTSQVKTLESRLTSTQLDLQDSQEKVKRCLTMHKHYWQLTSLSGSTDQEFNIKLCHSFDISSQLCT